MKRVKQYKKKEILLRVKVDLGQGALNSISQTNNRYLFPQAFWAIENYLRNAIIHGKINM